ncbi:cell division protein FtsA [Peribacillus loiseleuriae]|uniref:Cell division protein n=1 Tax=Peribacillus loiseleuriae TaxID=1679170 RepID=A0A0K9GXB2_9BACI|nr:cell division protein FtsA [Peribacillus loiseleuriae]KMY51283.1 cell division protein [Peribacillus loiseleuriae]
MHEKLFALDIGTRSVVGIILEKTADSFEVTDIVSMEHQERAMLDGQIHDVIAVSKVIQTIKDILEKKHGSLHNVSVAAAGRALKTEPASISIDINGKSILQHDDILHLELSAVQKAQAIVAEKNNSSSNHHYYCVGYSVLYYRLDDQEIGSLIDQSGTKVSVEIIATFLPKAVVESLLAALKRADLHMQALTLEPIAAINVLIPQSMRRLNVALVDIGAGTSDIALTDSGTVIAYGMVPIAGDEITEAISDSLLLDFPLAETAKRQLIDQEIITVTDILGFETEIPSTEVVESIMPSIEKLADAISQEIYILNNNIPPKAVMLVGGGSLTPKLPEILADKLNLPKNRVAIRGIEAIGQLTIADHVHSGPELVTPIGIALAAHKSPIQYMSVNVNGQTIRLFDMKEMTVGDCLLTAGIKLNKLYGRPGMAMMVKFNGQLITIPGEHGTKPILTINGKDVSLDYTVQDGDEITVQQGDDGRSPRLSIKDLADGLPSKQVTINDAKHTIHAELRRNDQVVTGEEFLHDNDRITCTIPGTLEELFTKTNKEDLLRSVKPFTVTVNEKEVTLPAFGGKIVKNGIPTNPTSTYEDGDVIEMKSSRPLTTDLAYAMNAQLTFSIPVTFNGKKLRLTKKLAEFYRDGHTLTSEDVINHGDTLSFVQNKMEPFIFQDVFMHIDIDMPEHIVGGFLLMKNKQETTFNETLAPGDELNILWPTSSPT